MKTLFLALGLLSALPALADTSYYCNGSYKKSGETWYYPNGSYAQSGSTTYYPNGSYLMSGDTLYYSNGSYLRSGSTFYYANGSYLKSGDTFYYQNGSYLKSGSTCYYQNGSYMGSCPSSYNLDLGSDTSAIETKLDLASGEVASYIYRTTFSSNPLTLKLGKDGSVEDIAFPCASEPDNEVKQILDQYMKLDGQKKSKVREQICGA